MKTRFTLHDFTQENHHRGNKLQNQKQGHFSLFRSLLSAEWTKDPIKLAIWIRLLSEASFRDRSVEFVGKTWALKPGELVTTSTILASRVHDEKGSPIQKRHVLRILKYFESQNMIKVKSNPFASVIFITNYCQYQDLESGTPHGTPSGTPDGTPKAINGAALKVVGGTRAGTPQSTPGGTQNNTDNNTEIQNTSSSRSKKGRSSGRSRSKIRSDAAIQSPSGKFWGTADDLRLAKWIYDFVTQVSATVKEPVWSSWANDIRLIRFGKECDHRTIAKTFKWANSDGFWQTNVLSPSNLRRHWEQIYPKSQTGTSKTKTHERTNIDFDNDDWAEGLKI